MSEILNRCNKELAELMKSVNQRIDATIRGEPALAFEIDELRSLMLCVGEALFANYRELKKRSTTTGRN